MLLKDSHWKAGRKQITGKGRQRGDTDLGTESPPRAFWKWLWSLPKPIISEPAKRLPTSKAVLKQGSGRSDAPSEELGVTHLGPVLLYFRAVGPQGHSFGPHLKEPVS